MNDRKIAYVAAGSAVGLGGTAALLASCCAAPWAVALFGTASAAALARASNLHPYLLVAAALSMGGIFWLACRRRPVDRPLAILACALGAMLIALFQVMRA